MDTVVATEPASAATAGPAKELPKETEQNAKNETNNSGKKKHSLVSTPSLRKEKATLLGMAFGERKEEAKKSEPAAPAAEVRFLP